MKENIIIDVSAAECKDFSFGVVQMNAPVMKIGQNVPTNVGSEDIKTFQPTCSYSSKPGVDENKIRKDLEEIVKVYHLLRGDFCFSKINPISTSTIDQNTTTIKTIAYGYRLLFNDDDDVIVIKTFVSNILDNWNFYTL